MRTITANALAELAKKLGSEPVIILEIQWTQDGQIHRYGDITDTTNRIEGNILEISGLDNVITISGVSQGTTGESLQLSVTLDDRGNSIKDILDQNDVHKRPVWVYQWFPNLDFSDKFLIYKGQVSSPLEWHESDRSVHFDVINQLEDAEVGFSIEEGNFEFAPDDLYGKAWPLVFGTCIHVPALKLRQVFKGTLRTGFGIRDFTLVCKLDQLNHMCCPLIFAGWRTERTPLGSIILRAKFEEEPGCKCRRLSQISQWEADLTEQATHELATLIIINGELFPQGESVTLDICGAKVTGIFSGETFSVSNYVHPEEAAGVVCLPTKSFLNCNVRESPVSEGGTNLGNGFYSERDIVPGFNSGAGTSCLAESPTDDRTNLGWDYLSRFPTADFFWAEPGCEVFLSGDEEIVYVVNLLPSTILRVAAFRTFESGVRELVTVPSSLYTTRISDFNGYMVTEIVFTRELSRRNEGWEDEIFVSQTSTVGPNTVEILEWLIDKYTDFTTDTASFLDVKNKLENYPSSFPLLERRNIFEVLKNIAFQARCALYLRNDVFTIHYLAEEPSVDFTIGEDDVLPKSLILTHTETEDLVTKFVAKWKSDYAIEDPNRVILRYNVKRYGTQEKTFDFFIYNIRELVEKSATFWLIRMANTWKRLRFRTPMNKLQSEVFDVANVTLPDFSANTIKTLVEKATYDSDNHEIEFELWTPVRAGETEQFIFSWPAMIDIDNIWPTLEDQELGNAGGSGPNVDVTAPALHPLTRPDTFAGSITNTNCNKIGVGSPFEAVSSILADSCRDDHGDKRPSDQDDTKPTVKVSGQGETDVPTSKNPTGTATNTIIINNQEPLQDEADMADSTIRNEFANDGSSGTESGVPPTGNAVEQLPCLSDDPDDPQSSTCQIRVSWSEILVTKVVNEIDGITTEIGKTGVILEGESAGGGTLYFDNPESAQAAKAALEALASVEGTNGEVQVQAGTVGLPISDISAWHSNNCDEEEGYDPPQAGGYCQKSGTDNSDSAQAALEAGLGV